MSSSLLIDFDNIIGPNKLTLLENKTQPVPETKHSLGLVLVVSDQEHRALNSIPKGESRVKYINTTPFVNSITGHAYTIYDKKKRLCEIMGLSGAVLPEIMDSILSHIPNDVTLWVGIVLDDPHLDILIREYVKAGFCDPYICKASPLGFAFRGYGLCMLRQNDIVNNDATNDVKYVLTQFMAERQGHCTLHARLSSSSIEYLRQISKIGSTDNKDGKISQKELAGRFLTGCIDSSLVYNLDVDRQSIVSGEEEGVEIVGSLYNFHSHPREAYDRHGVQMGWPSPQDHVGFLSSSIKYDTILHIVASIEGFYVVSLTEHWANKKEKLDKKVVDFILENYDIRYQIGKTPTWYTRTVNSIAYEGYPVFLVQFFSWNDASSDFIVPYRKTGVNCFARQSTIDKYRQLY